MGAIGGSIWHGVKGFRNSPHVRPNGYWTAFHEITLLMVG